MLLLQRGMCRNRRGNHGNKSVHVQIPNPFHMYRIIPFLRQRVKMIGSTSCERSWPFGVQLAQTLHFLLLDLKKSDLLVPIHLPILLVLLWNLEFCVWISREINKRTWKIKSRFIRVVQIIILLLAAVTSPPTSSHVSPCFHSNGKI